MLKTISRTAAAVAILALPLAGCGDGDSAGSGGVDAANADLKVHALDSLKFDKPEYTVKGGDITVALINDGSLQHDLLIEGKSGFKILTNARETKASKVNLPPATYTIFCDVPTHRDAGMESTLVVTAPPAGSASSGPSSGN